RNTSSVPPMILCSVYKSDRGRSCLTLTLAFSSSVLGRHHMKQTTRTEADRADSWF
ncbi:hypothetical protein WMY93_031463, partial [Mugilogobius chulae]